MSKYTNIILNLLFPLKCEVCHKKLPLTAAKRICSSCWHNIQLITDRYCQRCGKPMLVETALCVDCYGNDSLYFGRIRSAGVYTGNLREAIHRFKYSGRSMLRNELGELLLSTYNRHFSFYAPDYILPIPLHRKQKRKREYNQTEILARHLSKNCHVPVYGDGLIRVKETKPQFELNKKERRENVRDAFALSRKRWVKNKRVLLIDDICTTGATLNECAKVLHKNAAAEVNGLVLAHG